METPEAIARAHEAEEAGEHGEWSQKTGVVVVAVLAALLALASVYGRRSVADLLLFQEQAVDAANIAESNAVKERINESTLLLLRVFATDPDTQRAAEREIATMEAEITQTFRPQQERLEARAEMLNHRRERAERRYESFEWAETTLQMAIVFTTIAVAARSRNVLWASIAIGVVGLILVVDGFITVLPF